MNGFAEKSRPAHARSHIKLLDGKPKVAWEPKTNCWTGAVKDEATLDGEWKAVEGATAAKKAAMRFFKVVVVQ